MKDLNQKIISLINKYGDDKKAALRDNVNLDCFMALAPLRENLLEWYEFKKDASLLQVGADFGALTGLFMRRVGKVDVWDEAGESLEVVRARFPEAAGEETRAAGKEADKESAGEAAPGGRAEESKSACGSAEAAEGTCADRPAAKARDGRLSLIGGPLRGLSESGKRYDYVVCVGTMKEPKEEWASLLVSLLKPGGRLLLAAENRFGLKYMAGAGRDAVSVTRKRLSRLFPGCAFYYPMPDYRVPSVIYSDQFLPGKGELSGMHPLYDFPEYLSMDVGADFEAACEDGQFANFADSFLIIWEKGE